MPHWVPSWQLAVTVAGCVAVVSVGLRIWMRGKTGTRERRLALTGLIGWQAAVLVAAYGLWQYTGSLALVGTNDGLDRGRRLWDFERRLHLPSEASFQRLFLPHHAVVRFLNLYYVVAHYNVLLIMLGWLIWRHRDRYAEARTVILLATFTCLAVQLIRSRRRGSSVATASSTPRCCTGSLSTDPSARASATSTRPCRRYTLPGRRRWHSSSGARPRADGVTSASRTGCSPGPSSSPPETTTGSTGSWRS